MRLRLAARWALACCALAGALPASAQATHGTPFLNEELARYMAIAHAHWGGPIPTCVQNGVTAIPAHAVLYDDPDPSVAARSTQPGCEIWLDRGNWRAMRPVEACMIVVHEWGHLLGTHHSQDPLDLMAELPVRPPRACRDAASPVRRASASASRRCGRARKGGRRARPARRHAARRACARRAL